MPFKLQIFAVFILISLLSCTPEDGFCVEETHSGGDDFSCSQLDEHFSATGAGIEQNYTTKTALYDGSFVTVSGSDTILVDRPDYIPETIDLDRMTSCTIAPSIGGVDCNSWYSFEFSTTAGDTVTISSRKGSDFNENMALYYLVFETSGIKFDGYINSSKIGIYDTAAIDSKPVDVVHRYTFRERASR